MGVVRGTGREVDRRLVRSQVAIHVSGPASPESRAGAWVLAGGPPPAATEVENGNRAGNGAGNQGSWPGVACPRPRGPSTARAPVDANTDTVVRLVGPGGAWAADFFSGAPAASGER